MDTPAWLQANTTEATTNTAAAPVADQGGITSIPPPAPPTPAQLQAAAADNDDDDPDLPGIILVMRLANIGVAVAIIVVSVRFGFYDSGKLTQEISIMRSVRFVECNFCLVLKFFSSLHVCIFADTINDTITFDQLLCTGNLRHMWWFIDLLLRNAIEICTCYYCN